MLAVGYLGLASSSKAIDQAWEFLKFATSQESGVQKDLQGWGAPGARPDVYNDPRLQAANPVYKLAAIAMETCGLQANPYNLRDTEMNSVITNEMDKIWLNQVDVATGLKNTQAEVQKVLDLPR